MTFPAQSERPTTFESLDEFRSAGADIHGSLPGVRNFH
jgi:hypothetical protein